jgi:Holliday junction resolvasome RuvABC endonuclease subunit
VNYFVGIDPSMNSTGLCIQQYEGEQKIKENFFIIKPSTDKLTKKEKLAEESSLYFEYIFYKAEDLKAYSDNNLFHEYWKSFNMIQLVKKIKETILEYTKLENDHIHIVIEGISYGSMSRTKSIFDLAGLNYMVRNYFIEKDNITFWIVPPAEIKKFTTGNGLAKKEAITHLFESSHPELKIIPKIDDIADAYFMACYSNELSKKWS